jgi:SAM-dependent methyltransferase
MVTNMSRLARKLASRLAQQLAPTRWKERDELRYWAQQKAAEGILANDHYAYFYTTHFGLSPAFYENKTILDIGCGPRGSLVWASMAARRIGLDPLARKYLRLGASDHPMEYVAAPSEAIPLQAAACDAVSSFNSLDHVQDVCQTLSEIKRVTRPGGLFLLLVEVNHPPTRCEPHQLTPKRLVEALRPEFTCESLQVYKPAEAGIYDTIRANHRLFLPEGSSEVGYMSAKFLRVPASP